MIQGHYIKLMIVPAQHSRNNFAWLNYTNVSLSVPFYIYG